MQLSSVTLIIKKIFFKLNKPMLVRRIIDRIRSYFFIEQWIFLITKDINEKIPSWKNFTRFIPTPDRVWADPFIWTQNEKHYIFFEEQPLDTYRGRICCLTLDTDLNIINNQPVLERPYHLSYPFIFKYGENLYMLPETGENRTIEIYRCTKFPDKWELEKVLMSNVYAFDATLFEFNKKWWLFANISEEGESTWDTLKLFYSDNPLSEQWTPHPKNPIVKDISSARPAGKIFKDEKGFIRPSQDSAVRYGYAINFNRIETLTEFEYSEVREWTFTPKPIDIIATHTWNQDQNLLAIDAKLIRAKFALK